MKSDIKSKKKKNLSIDLCNLATLNKSKETTK